MITLEELEDIILKEVNSHLKGESMVKDDKIDNFLIDSLHIVEIFIATEVALSNLGIKLEIDDKFQASYWNESVRSLAKRIYEEYFLNTSNMLPSK